MTGARRRPPRTAVELLVTFVGLGATGAVFGPALPALAGAVGVTVATASLSIVALFAGLLVAVVVLRLADARAARHLDAVRLAGALAQALALLAVGLATSLPGLLVASTVAGLGFGASEAGASALVVVGHDGAGRLSRLGAAFAVAAIVTPALVSVSLLLTAGVTAALLVVAGLHLLAAGLQGRPRGRPVGRGADRGGSAPGTTSAVLGGVLVLYVGAEVLLSTWAAELTRTLLDVPASAAALAAAGFWACLAVGRWLGGRWARAVAPTVLLRRLLAVASVALLSATAATPLVDGGGGAATAVVVTVGIAVVALGPIYALTLAHGSTTAGSSTSRSGTSRSALGTAAGRIGLGAVGGMAVPAVVAGLVTGPTTVLLGAGLLTAAAAGLATRPT